MEMSVGITPTQLRSWFGKICLKCGHWLLLHWYVFAYIIGGIIALVIIYKFIRNHLSNYYKFKDEKSIYREKRTVQA